MRPAPGRSSSASSAPREWDASAAIEPGRGPKPNRCSAKAALRRESRIMAPPHWNIARRLVETGNQIAPGPELDGRSGEIIAHGLGPAAQMLGKKHFEDGIERAAIFLPPESVAFVRIVDVGHRNIARLHGADDLLGFRRLDPHVVGAL